MESSVAIIGAGVTGLSAGMELGERAIVFEKSKTVGGVVKSICFDGYWFDNVVHLLHFRNDDTKGRIKELMGDMLKPCPPVGWVVTKEGTVRYPLQLNIGGLNDLAQIRCITDYLIRIRNVEPSSYREFLECTFGSEMCNIFFYPYNEKLWKYPLDDMTASGLVWNINAPDLEAFTEGILHPNQPRNTYNTNAYYPQPPESHSQRGMGLLTKALAEKVNNLVLNYEVQKIDVKAHKLISHLDYCNYDKLLSTIPLPALMRLCDAPASLMAEVSRLRWNNVLSVAIAVKGDRPKDTGHWRYFADPELPFTKVIYMTEFDTHNAPEDGFGLLVEVPIPSTNTHEMNCMLFNKANLALEDVDVLKSGDKVVDINAWIVDPAYVIFTKETPSIVWHCKEYLAQFGITPLGRYGSWEYSSMAENIEDGFNYAKSIKQ